MGRFGEIHKKPPISSFPMYFEWATFCATAPARRRVRKNGFWHVFLRKKPFKINGWMPKTFGSKNDLIFNTSFHCNPSQTAENFSETKGAPGQKHPVSLEYFSTLYWWYTAQKNPYLTNFTAIYNKLPKILKDDLHLRLQAPSTSWTFFYLIFMINDLKTPV